MGCVPDRNLVVEFRYPLTEMNDGDCLRLTPWGRKNRSGWPLNVTAPKRLSSDCGYVNWASPAGSEAFLNFGVLKGVSQGHPGAWATPTPPRPPSEHMIDDPDRQT